MRCLWAIAILLLFAGPLAAAPDLDRYRDIDGVRLYRDQRQADLWYLTPAIPQLQVEEDQSPAYRFDLFRYYGRKATGDRETFRAHGVLSLTVNRERPAEQLSRIRAALQAAGIPRPKLRSMPIAGADIRLLFAGQSQQWQQGSRWSGGTFVLPLHAEPAQLLWQAVELGQLQVSLVVEEQLRGVRPTGTAESSWQDEVLVHAWTLPVGLDRQRYADHFRRVDLSGRMSHGYTGLDVFCFDFLESLVPGLYAKTVEVAIPSAGRDLVESVTFRQEGDYRGRIDFRLVRDLDQPYRIRITEIYDDGRRVEGPWQEKQGDSLLDITAYREPAEQEPVAEAATAEEAEFNGQEVVSDGN